MDSPVNEQLYPFQTMSRTIFAVALVPELFVLELGFSLAGVELDKMIMHHDVIKWK